MQGATQTAEKTIEVSAAEYQMLLVELRLLTEQVKYLQSQLYGTKSERHMEHPELFEREAEPEKEAPALETKIAAHTRKRKHPGRNPFPEHLPREVIKIDLEDGCTCSQCGSEMAELPPEITKELERVPARLFVKEYHRQKCACRHCQGEIRTAPAPSRPIEKGIAGPGLLAQCVVDKFADHIPANRQEKRFKREGIHLPRQTICGWFPQLDAYTKHIVAILKEDLLCGGYLQADETPIPVQKKEKPGKNHKGFLWLYGRPDGPVVYDFRMSRARAGPIEFLKGFEGILQHDGYRAYWLIEGEIIHVSCMSHIRRKFWEAQKLGDKDAVKVVRAIKRLYRIEKIATKAGMDAAARYALRQERSAKRMDLLKLRVEKLMLRALPKSKLGKACTYALSQWPYMMNYLKDGRIQIDNNICENAVRPVKLGKNNWQHIGSEAAGPVAANFMSLVETCKRYEVDPVAYFTDVFTRIADHPLPRIAELTPYNWAEARREATQST